MTPDAILQSAGTSPDELNSMVDQYRQFTEPHPDMLLADHFDVEYLATAIVDLASRLEEISSLVAPHLDGDSDVTRLAQAINSQVAPYEADTAAGLVERHLGVEEIPAGADKIIGEKTIYGYPQLRYVTHGYISIEKMGYTRTNYIVHLPSATIYEVLAGESPVEAAERVARLAAGQDDRA